MPVHKAKISKPENRKVFILDEVNANVNLDWLDVKKGIWFQGWQRYLRLFRSDRYSNLSVYVTCQRI